MLTPKTQPTQTLKTFCKSQEGKPNLITLNFRNYE